MPTLRLHKSITAHTDRIWSLSPHPTLPLLASASSDRTAALTSLTTYTPLPHPLDGAHKRSIRTLSFHPTSPTPVLATGSFDATVGIWRAPADASDPWDFALVLDGHESEVKSIAWSAGGSFLATCSRDKSVWVWEEDGEDNFDTVAVLVEHTQDVKFVRWHPHELLLASASYDETVRMWREVHGEWECVALLEGHAGTVWCVDWEKTGEERRLVTVGDDLRGLVWERRRKGAGEKGAVPSVLRGADEDEVWVVCGELPKVHERSVYSVSWGEGGRVVTGGGDGRVVVYEEVEVEGKKEWRVVAEVEGAHGVYEVNCVVWCKRFDQDRRGETEEVVASAGDDGEIRIWTIEE